jgi:hypothetical protein
MLSTGCRQVEIEMITILCRPLLSSIVRVSLPHFSIDNHQIVAALMTIAIAYNLLGNGWAECIVEINDRQAHITASYLSDALADLPRAMG